MNYNQEEALDVNNRSFKEEETLIDAKALLFKVIGNWYLILISVALGILLARLYLRYSVPIYKAKAKILIKEDPSGSGGLSEEAVLQELGLFKSSTNILNEMQILKSRMLMEEVVKKLNLDVRYIGLGRLKNTEFYLNSPMKIDSVHWGNRRKKAELELEVIDRNSFRLFGDEQESTHFFNQPFELEGNTFWVSPNLDSERMDSRLLVKIREVRGAAINYLEKLEVDTEVDYSSVLVLEIQDQVAQKAADILNVLVQEYNQATIDDKNQVAEKTLDFINERLYLLTPELSDVEKDVVNYKERNEIPTEANLAVEFVLSEIGEYDNELSRQEIKLELLRSIEGMLSGDVEQYELIPANLMLEGTEGLELQIGSYNELLLDRERLKFSVSENNPQLQNINQRLLLMRANISESLRGIRQNVQSAVDETRDKLGQLQSRIDRVPKQERELLEIRRQQNIKETLYLFLLQKKEETALSSAITVPNARMIDRAVASRDPVSPKSFQVYLIFLMMGFTLPIGIIFLREYLDNKIYSESEIKKLTAMPVVGSLAQNRGTERVVVKTGSRSAIAEMFRLLRANLNYLVRGREYQSILITSGMSGDGKTFITVNLGTSLALFGKKVILLGMDLRKPKLANYLLEEKDKSLQGLTDFLVGDVPIEDLFHASDLNENLYLIPSGPIPPNPAELLSSERMGVLFDYLRDHFDYILIDTAPIGLVADAFLLDAYADITLFAVRSGKTHQEIVRWLEQLRVDQKLKNPAIVLNGVKKRKGYGYNYGYGYGNGYGYGYYETDKPKSWWWNSGGEERPDEVGSNSK